MAGRDTECARGFLISHTHSSFACTCAQKEEWGNKLHSAPQPHTKICKLGKKEKGDEGQRICKKVPHQNEMHCVYASFQQEHAEGAHKNILEMLHLAMHQFPRSFLFIINTVPSKTQQLHLQNVPKKTRLHWV